MQTTARQAALEKLAFYGTAYVPGSPVYLTPPPTVGQVMGAMNGNPFMNGAQRRSALDQIVSSGIDVNSPAKSLLKAGIGALAGNFIATALKTGPFARGIMTAAGANYGYNY